MAKKYLPGTTGYRVAVYRDKFPEYADVFVAYEENGICEVLSVNLAVGGNNGLA